MLLYQLYYACVRDSNSLSLRAFWVVLSRLAKKYQGEGVNAPPDPSDRIRSGTSSTRLLLTLREKRRRAA
jgi:hypothetical protein